MEDDIANTIGLPVLSLISRRTRSCMFLFAKASDDKEVASETLDDMQRHEVE